MRNPLVHRFTEGLAKIATRHEPWIAAIGNQHIRTRGALVVDIPSWQRDHWNHAHRLFRWLEIVAAKCPAVRPADWFDLNVTRTAQLDAVIAHSGRFTTIGARLLRDFVSTADTTLRPMTMWSMLNLSAGRS